MSLRSQKKVEFVYDLPYAERMELCKIMDLTDKWELLASLMGYDVMTIRTFRRARQSPTDELLTEWGHRNGTVLKLFGYLSQMQHYQAMLAIKRFVDPEYHRLIYEGKGMLSSKPSSSHESACAIKPRGMSVNLNDTQSCNILPSKMEGIRMSESNTTSTESKILNVDPRPPAATETRPSSSRPSPSQASTLKVHNDNDVRSAESSRARESPDLSIGVDSGPPMIKYKELEVATNGWDPAAVLGKGGFGIVYKGIWKNTHVAVKRTLVKDADGSATIQMQQILAELRMLNAYRHDSVLPLYGFSVDGEDPCLIYQFMPNGSLEDRLLCRQGTNPLTWAQRLNVATETARGLQWLHTIKDKPLIHGDIKSANILLDLNYQPKIGDFGLAREGPQSQYTHMKISKIHGTRPYLPDEFLRARKFSTKVDTHCFGVVLFELATGLRPYDEHRNHKYLRDLIGQSSDAQVTHLVDRKAVPSDPHIFLVLIDLGKLCVKHKPKERPEMVTVLQALEGATAQRMRAQIQAAQGGPRSVSPFDLQRHYDQLGQQRTNVSPLASGATPRVHSPMPMSISPVPPSDTGEDPRFASPVPFHLTPIVQGGRLSPLIINTPQHTLPPDNNSHGKDQVDQRLEFSPTAGEVPLTIGAVADSPSGARMTTEFDVTAMIPTTVPATVPSPPAIAVTPPSDSTEPSFTSNSTSTTTVSLATHENSIASNSDSFQESSFNIPNIPALGMKTEEGAGAETGESSQISNATPNSAKGKALWIINGSGKKEVISPGEASSTPCRGDECILSKAYSSRPTLPLRSARIETGQKHIVLIDIKQLSNEYIKR